MTGSVRSRGATGDGLPACLSRAGFNAIGVLPAADYDRRVPVAWRSAEVLPRARSVFVLACGGRPFGSALQAAPEWRDRGQGPDPVDRFCERIVGEAARELETRAPCRAAFAHRPRGGQFADFVGLAQACGLGSASRLGLLVSPDFGPWLSIRALLLWERDASPSPPLSDFDPCCDCPAPCEEVCPARAPTAGGFEVSRCAAFRRSEDRCAHHCDARRACVVHPEQAYDRELEAHFSAASLRMLHS